MYPKNNGFYIFSEKWDNMIILDACRFDTFKEIFIKRKMKGRLEKRISRGSHTTTFLLENFKKEKYKNVIYLTSNPHVDRIIGEKLFKVISVWKDGWNDKFHTVLPETMYQHALEAILKFPEKKMIIHFIQPHFPYIGYNFGVEDINHLKDSVFSNTKKKRKYRDRLFTFYGLDLYAIIDKKSHLKLYRRNLELVIPYVEKLTELLPGKTIVTSDHGESFGEFLHPLIPIKLYSHNKHFRSRVLVNIPWLIVEEKEKNLKKVKELRERQRILSAIKNLKKY